MADAPQSGIGEFLSVLSGVNPLSGIQRSIGQFQQGITSFLKTIENLNVTLEQFNRIAIRVNNLLDAVEEPMKTLVPGLNQLSKSLSSPPMMTMSDDLGDFLKVIRDLGKRMQPLTQLAESAGSMFNLRALGNLLPGSQRTPASLAAPAPGPSPAPASTAAPPPRREPTEVREPAPPPPPAARPRVEQARARRTPATGARVGATKRTATKKSTTAKKSTATAKKSTAKKRASAKKAPPSH